MIRVEDHERRWVTYDYNQDGMLAIVTRSDGRARHYSYDGHLMTVVRDEAAATIAGANLRPPSGARKRFFVAGPADVGGVNDGIDHERPAPIVVWDVEADLVVVFEHVGTDYRGSDSVGLLVHVRSALPKLTVREVQDQVAVAIKCDALDAVEGQDDSRRLIVDLTRDQKRKPLLGSGNAIPIGFGPLACVSRLLLGSDGLFEYVPHERIRDLSNSLPLANAAAALVDAARLPSGALQDDVAVIVAG